jgi:hypothetical protein
MVGSVVGSLVGAVVGEALAVVELVGVAELESDGQTLAAT